MAVSQESDFSDPSTEPVLYFPALHSEQVVAPAPVEYLPARQFWHCVTPTPEK